MLPITTTLNRIRAHSPCEDGWAKLLAGLGKTKADDEPLAYATIMRIVGIADALWCCCAEPQHAATWRMAAVRFARRVQHLMTDQRSLAAIDVAKRHAQGLATDAELAAAGAAARDAAWAAAWAAARAAARAAAEAAWAAAEAARATARDAAEAARATARDAAEATTWAAARDAAEATTWAAARAAEREAQAAIFLELVGGE